eukprot:CAMPEP_0181317326 /NCGR_PEP_ID=MMETSP1101-20121128/16409_1 /TAXON_ID=46948 /ORGANISM="Rhodomonas abbreviata, Strain Caron Lab Isolate" /LENGTH=205 /DNA_ID=CAMNT_0023424713 /DNA_START=21 /DNA_END=638 /DNA_ORIENTATION=+
MTGEVGTSNRFVNVYPLDSYKIGQKDERKEKDSSVPARMSRMESLYESEGLRRTVEGVLLVHQHKHPHVLLLQIGSSFFKLPGGRMKPGETEIEGLKRKLVNKLAPPNTDPPDLPQWEVGEELATWWRPNFDSHMYPYLPAHVTRPKESKKLFLVHLPENCTFAIARNHSLVAVPLYELHDNHQRYGPVIASIPLLLARLSAVCA